MEAGNVDGIDVRPARAEQTAATIESVLQVHSLLSHAPVHRRTATHNNRFIAR